MKVYDYLIIGGGFYGCTLGIHLSQKLEKKILIVEKEKTIMTRASYANQARIHQGYHYPRDFTTAYRSRVSFQNFVDKYRDCVVEDFTSVYAIASRNSHVSARQFESMMKAIGAPCTPAQRKHAALFSPRLIEAVFETKEFAFDSLKLAKQVKNEIENSKADIILSHEVIMVEKKEDYYIVTIQGDTPEVIKTYSVIDCTYGMLGRTPGLPTLKADLKYEFCELALVETPDPLRDIGITIMDGPFFSCMPFPSRGLHSFTHVRWTPRSSWTAQTQDKSPYKFADMANQESNFSIMRDDAARFVPLMSEVKHIDSIFEIKTVLVANEENDGRPILIEGTIGKGGITSILGGKMDNMFDVLMEFDARIKEHE